MWHPIQDIEVKLIMKQVMYYLTHWKNIAAIAVPIIIFLTPSLHAYANAHPDQLIGALITALLTAVNTRRPKDTKQ